MSKIHVLTLLFFLVLNSKSISQPTPHFSVSYNVPSGNGFDVLSSGSAGNDAMEQQFRQINAYNFAIEADLNREYARFYIRSSLSANIVNKMNSSFSTAAKYPNALALYKKSFAQLKTLEPTANQVAGSINKPFPDRQKTVFDARNQQAQTMQSALQAYHQALDMIELGDNKETLINNAALDLRSANTLSTSDREELKKLKSDIKFAESQIQKLTRNIYDEKKLTEAARADITQQKLTIATNLKTFTSIVQKVIEILSPSEKTTLAVGVTQSIIEKYIEETVANNEPPTAALNRAFAEGYNKFKTDVLATKSFPGVEKYTKIPLLAKEAYEVVEKWNEAGKAQTEAIEMVDRVIENSENAIALNQSIIDKSNAKMRPIVERAVNHYIGLKPIRKRMP